MPSSRGNHGKDSRIVKWSLRSFTSQIRSHTPLISQNILLSNYFRCAIRYQKRCWDLIYFRVESVVQFLASANSCFQLCSNFFTFFIREILKRLRGIHSDYLRGFSIIFWPIATVETSMSRSKFDFFFWVLLSFPFKFLTSGERTHQVKCKLRELTIPSREFKQPWRLRQIKRHLKINIFAIGTTLRLMLFFSHSILLTNYSKTGLIGATYI